MGVELGRRNAVDGGRDRFCRVGVDARLAPDAKGLVGRREVAMRRVVVHVLLDDRIDRDGLVLGQSLPDRTVVGPNLHFHLVHGRTENQGGQKRGRWVRNVVLKC